MSTDTVADDAPVLFEERVAGNGARIGIATLNAPRTLNGFSLPMAHLLLKQLKAWADDDGIAMVVLQGAGEKAFCAGGDLHSLYKSMVAFREAGCSDIRENDYAAEFFDVEYRVDHLIHTYAKPILCWGHGIVMGGGIGLMSGVSHRVVSERSKLAFPEITVGLFPDVGGSWLLPRVPGKGGLFLALTGALLNPGDAIYAGLADVHVAEERRSAVFDALLQVAWWLLVVLFFSIPQGKRDVYILPALPMFCLALAPLLPGLLKRRDVQRVLGGFAALLALGLSLVGALALLGDPRFEVNLAHGRGLPPGATDALAWTILAMGLWGGLSLVVTGWRRSHLALLSTLAVAWVLYGLFGYPLLNDSSSARGLMRDVGARLGLGAELGLVAWKEQNLLMADRRAATFGFENRWHEQLQAAVRWQRLVPQHRWLLVNEDAMQACIDRAQAEMAGISNRRRWWLVPADAVAGTCRPSAAELEHERRLQGPGLTD